MVPLKKPFFSFFLLENWSIEKFIKEFFKTIFSKMSRNMKPTDEMNLLEEEDFEESDDEDDSLDDPDQDYDSEEDKGEKDSDNFSDEEEY